MKVPLGELLPENLGVCVGGGKVVLPFFLLSLLVAALKKGHAQLLRGMAQFSFCTLRGMAQFSFCTLSSLYSLNRMPRVACSRPFCSVVWA